MPSPRFRENRTSLPHAEVPGHVGVEQSYGLSVKNFMPDAVGSAALHACRSELVARDLAEHARASTAIEKPSGPYTVSTASGAPSSMYSR